jgi:formylglycine-generating enzyme required for sulfatase activity
MRRIPPSGASKRETEGNARKRRKEMFGKGLIRVWVGILVLSGMFLLGQDSWEPAECTDLDGDGYGSPADVSCMYPELDCDDGNADVYPGAPELCDEVDNQCEGDEGYGEVDEGCDMVQIPAGCFDMGDPFGEGHSGELPVHNVCISAFEMDVHEVTNAEYAACVDDGACTLPFHTMGTWERPTYYGDPAYDDFPVIWVSWDQATDYCTWAGKRLPTEAEWEYAARGGLAGKRYPWGDTISGSDANYLDSGDPWDNDTSQVEYYAPNGYGLYDMAGNVWEWVNDPYDASYYQYCVDHGIVNDPPGPATGTGRMIRGGSWESATSSLRVAARYWQYPGNVYWEVGIRCAR